MAKFTSSLLTLFILILALQTTLLAQESVKKTMESENGATQVTISKSGISVGTQSQKAQEYFDQATEYGNKRDLENARAYYQKAIDEDPMFVEAYDNLGQVYRNLGDIDNAIQNYLKSIELYPEGIVAHQNLAVAYSLKKDYEAAIGEYENILKIAPENPEGYFGLANTQMMMSQFDQALKNAHKALDIYKKTNSSHLSDGYYMIGLIHYYSRSIPESRKFLQLAKDAGAQIHPQIEKEVFASPKQEGLEYTLDTPADYAEHEQDVMDAYAWLLTTPLGQQEAKRKELSAFLITWVTGSPNVTVEISQEIVNYQDGCQECLVIFLGGWASNALKTKQFDNKVNGALAGTKGVIQFYRKNRVAIGKVKAIEALMDVQKKGNLKSYIENHSQ